MAESGRDKENGIGRELLLRLEEWLTVYDYVFLIPDGNGAAGTFVSAILPAAAGKTGGRRILLLSVVPVNSDAGFTCRQIHREEAEQLLELYLMYEFSDKFSLIATESAYGSLINLVETGVLPMEEAAQALFIYR